MPDPRTHGSSNNDADHDADDCNAYGGAYFPRRRVRSNGECEVRPEPRHLQLRRRVVHVETVHVLELVRLLGESRRLQYVWDVRRTAVYGADDRGPDRGADSEAVRDPNIGALNRSVLLER
jgi:hypothetical protein